MIKEIYINGKKIPVPVPLKNISAVIKWINLHFVKDGSLITSVVLEGNEVFDSKKSLFKKDHVLEPSSRLEILIDTPKNLSIDTIKMLAGITKQVKGKLKPLAVFCWQQGVDSDDDILKFINPLRSDMGIVLDLVEHLNGIVDWQQVEMAPINGIARLLKRVISHFDQAKLEVERRKMAEIMVNRLDPLFKSLIQETDLLLLKAVGLNDIESAAHGE